MPQTNYHSSALINCGIFEKSVGNKTPTKMSRLLVFKREGIRLYGVFKVSISQNVEKFT